MRERVEDLGRITVMVDQLLSLDVWDLYHGRKKDFEEFFRSLDEERQDDLLHKLIYGLDDVREKLCEISCIAEGTDRLNESSL
jgi:hypothetical protein